MNDKLAEKYLLLIVVIIGVLGLCALFSAAIHTSDITGAAIRTAITPLDCTDSDQNNPERKGLVYYESEFPDQCYSDKAVSQHPVNKGTYLREYTCENGVVSYSVYNCGTNDCQYGACISGQYTRIK